MSIDPENVISTFWGRPFLVTIMSMSFTLAVAVYVYVVEVFDPDKNFVSQVIGPIWGKSYVFYSGPEGGVYVNIGRILDGETSRRFGNTFNNVSTSGAFENATLVAGSPASCGITQEDTLAKDDPFREKLNYITPLYMERLHILYRSTDDKPEIITNNPASLRFLREGTIYTGHYLSGTKIFASYLIGYAEYVLSREQELGKILGKKQEDVGFSVKYAAKGFNRILEEMENADEADEQSSVIVMNIAGAPLRG